LHDVLREKAGEATDPELERLLQRLVDLSGDERVLVAGGEGLAAALERHVREVIGVEPDELAALPFERGTFDLVATLDALHHVRRPELAVAELARVTRLGGRLLVADQLGSIDPLTGIELDRAARARDPAHTRFLPDADMRGFFDSNGLVLLRSEVHSGTGWYLLRR
jgi:SAM-dependent methyltransferase